MNDKEALTHFPPGKMAAILTDDIFKCIFLNGNNTIPIQILCNKRCRLIAAIIICLQFQQTKPVNN